MEKKNFFSVFFNFGLLVETFVTPLIFAPKLLTFSIGAQIGGILNVANCLLHGTIAPIKLDQHRTEIKEWVDSERELCERTLLVYFPHLYLCFFLKWPYATSYVQYIDRE